MVPARGSGPRLLFQIHNRRGLGHLMRALNIAREIHALAADAEVVLYTRAEPALRLRDERVRYVVESDPAAATHWPEVARSVAPDVVVYDTLLPREPATEPVPPSARCAYIMRKARDDRQREIFAHPWLERVALILVPHEREELRVPLPDRLQAKTRFVGPIVRLPDPAAQGRLRERYGIGAGAFVLTSTVGGGGFAEQAQAFFDAVAGVHRRLLPAIPGLRHIAVSGPNFTGSLGPLPGMTVVRMEPELVDLFAISDLVIAEGGYNTVNEVRLTKTPAVFLPSRRGVDDQEERVRALEARGLARTLVGLDPEGVASRVLELVTAPGALAEMRRRYAGDRMALGNRAAAEALVELARWARG